MHVLVLNSFCFGHFSVSCGSEIQAEEIVASGIKNFLKIKLSNSVARGIMCAGTLELYSQVISCFSPIGGYTILFVGLIAA